MRCRPAVNLTSIWAPTLEWRLHESKEGIVDERRNLRDWANAAFLQDANISSSLTISLNETRKSIYYSCKICLTPEDTNQGVAIDNDTSNYNNYYERKSPLVASLPQELISSTQGT